MKLSTSCLLALASSCVAYTFNTSDIIDFNVTRSSYHIDIDNATDYEYWSLSATNASVPYANGTNITVAIIGDGVNANFLESSDSVSSVLDVYTNKTYIFSDDEITEDTLAARVLLANAPETTIKSYKIFQNVNSTTSITSKLVSALISAVNDDSIDFIYVNTWQAYGGWSTTFFSKLINQIAEIKPVVLPMGQNNGIFQFSDGAGAENVIAVGASGFAGTPGFLANIDGDFYGVYAEEYLSLYTNNTLVLGELDENCYLVNNISSDYHNMLFLDVGNCSAEAVVDAVMASNFTQLLTTGEKYQLYPFTDDSEIVSAMMERTQGLAILKRLEDGETVVAHSKTDTFMVTIDDEYDEFSLNFNQSMGPTLDLFLKPNILAQGSFYFDDLSIYATGTSLSAAYVAGAIAAFASASKSWSEGLVDRVTSSGSQVNFRNLTDIFSEIHNPVVQGGGIINVEEFILKDFKISPGYFSLGETNATTSVTFTLTNDDTEDKRFHIGGLDSITIYAQDSDVDANSNNMYRFPINGNTTAAELIIDKSTVIVKAGKSKNITVSITPPDYAGEETRIPVYGGYIQVTDLSTNFVSSIPYFGVTVEMHSLETQTEEEFYWKEMYYNSKGGRSMFMWVNGSVVNDTNHYLQIYYGDRIGSPMVDILVVDKDWTEDDFVYPPVAGENNYVERIMGTRQPGGYPWYNAPRTNISSADQWDDWHYGLLQDGTVIPSGDYKILLRILKHNYVDAGNWDEWYTHVSPWFTVDYANVTEVALPSTTIVISHASTTLSTVKTSSAAAATTTSMDMDMSGMDMGTTTTATTTSMDMDMSGMDMGATTTSSAATTTTSDSMAGMDMKDE